MKDVKHSLDKSKKPLRSSFSKLSVKYIKKSLSHNNIIPFIKILYFTYRMK